jgi:hypothetical protein
MLALVLADSAVVVQVEPELGLMPKLELVAGGGGAQLCSRGGHIAVAELGSNGGGTGG